MMTALASPRRSEDKAVALFAAHTWLNVSTPPLMTARFLAERGYEVDLFMDADPHMESLGLNLPRFSMKGFRVRLIPPAPSSQRDVALSEAGLDAPECLAPVRAFPRPPRDYAWLIGYDQGGLLRAAAMGRLWRKPYVFHSLEIDGPDNPRKHLEARLSRGAIYTLTQDELRADILADLNGLERSRIFVSRNSSLGEVLPERKNFFRERFPIGQRKVVLAAGTLLPHHCIDEIVLAARRWPEDFVLVLHGWIPDQAFLAWVRQELRGSDNIFLSTEVVPPEEKFTVFQSADIGLIFFKPHDINMASGAGSAGKFYDCIRCGVPVIGNSLEGMRELVEGNGCGMVTPDARGIAGALERMRDHLDAYRASCLKTFPEFEFSRTYDPILEHTERVLQDLDAGEIKQAPHCS